MFHPFIDFFAWIDAVARTRFDGRILWQSRVMSSVLNVFSLVESRVVHARAGMMSILNEVTFLRHKRRWNVHRGLVSVDQILLNAFTIIIISYFGTNHLQSFTSLNS